MSKQQIKQLIEKAVHQDGMFETNIKGVKLFRCTESIRCAPVVYEPSITAIVSGAKEAIWHGEKGIYNSSQYLCCTMPMPLEAGTPESSPESPLFGVYISLDTKSMTELVIEIEDNPTAKQAPSSGAIPQGFSMARWDEAFTDALYRLLQLTQSPSDALVLGKSRLRELYYAALKGDAGHAIRQTFGVGNEIARSIEFLSAHLHQPVTIDDMSSQAGMSRAVFHRKFKQATTLSPIQFIKSMRLNNAAIKIAEGTHVSVAAMEVGYVSSSQFSREFKRLYGQSPKQWRQTHRPS